MHIDMGINLKYLDLMYIFYPYPGQNSNDTV